MFNFPIFLYSRNLLSRRLNILKVATFILFIGFEDFVWKVQKGKNTKVFIFIDKCSIVFYITVEYPASLISLDFLSSRSHDSVWDFVGQRDGGYAHTDRQSLLRLHCRDGLQLTGNCSVKGQGSLYLTKYRPGTWHYYLLK